MGYYNSFVVKVWSEEQGGKVRGYIQHVSSQETSHFLSLERMLEFIRDHLDSPASPLVGGSRQERPETLSEDLETTNDEPT